MEILFLGGRAEGASTIDPDTSGANTLTAAGAGPAEHVREEPVPSNCLSAIEAIGP
jgi:hypothetical protein